MTPVRGDVANVLDLLYATIKTAAKRLDIVVANAGLEQPVRVGGLIGREDLGDTGFDPRRRR